eukprot:4532407-Pyramimonas_sp.AAC.1
MSKHVLQNPVQAHQASSVHHPMAPRSTHPEGPQGLQDGLRGLQEPPRSAPRDLQEAIPGVPE